MSHLGWFGLHAGSYQVPPHTTTCPSWFFSTYLRLKLLHSVISAPRPSSFFSFSAVLGGKAPSCPRAPSQCSNTQSRACNGYISHQPHPPPKIINCTTHSSSVRTCALAWRLSRMPPRCQPQTSLLLENTVVQRSRRAQLGRLRPPANYPDDFCERMAEPVALPKALPVPAL